jgi:MFS transporter, DHA1 family, multidrug resistance protein
MSERVITAKAQREQSFASPIDSQLSEVTTEAPTRAGTSIRALHVLVLGGLSAMGPLSTDMYLPALPV